MLKLMGKKIFTILRSKSLFKSKLVVLPVSQPSEGEAVAVSGYDVVR